MIYLHAPLDVKYSVTCNPLFFIIISNQKKQDEELEMIKAQLDRYAFVITWTAHLEKKN